MRPFARSLVMAALFLTATLAIAGGPASADAPSVSLVAPRGGERWFANQVHFVLWNASHGADAEIRATIRFSEDGGLTYPHFLTSERFPTPFAGHAWRVPVVNTTSARIEVCVEARDGGLACARSPGDFTIDTGTAPSPYLSLVSPADGANGVPVNASIVISARGVSPLNVTWTLDPPGSPSLQWSWTMNDTRLALVPVAPLAPCTLHTLTMDGGVTGPYVWSFTTACPPPRIVSWSHAGSPLAPVIATFSESMNESTVTWATTSPGQMFVGAWTNASTTLLLNASPPLNPCTTLTVWIVSGDDVNGSWLANPSQYPFTFTTDGCPPPYILATSPADGEGDVLPDADVVVTFSAAMDPATVAVTVVPDLPLVPGWSDPGANGTVLRLTHTQSFLPCTEYTVAITAGRDANGTDLVPGAAANPWSFNTECIAPYLASVSPADGAQEVPRDVPIVLDFSGPVDVANLTVLLSPQPLGLTPAWTNGDARLVLTHGGLTPCTRLVLSISGKLSPGPVPNPWSFDVDCVGAFVTMSVISPAGGDTWTGGATRAVLVELRSFGTATRDFAVNATYASGAGGGSIGSTTVTLPGGQSAVASIPWVLPAIDAADVLVRATATASSTGQSLTASSAPIAIDATVPTATLQFPRGYDVPAFTTIVAHFSEPLAPPANPFGVVVLDPSEGVAWTVSWSASWDRVTMSPTGLRACTRYKVTVGSTDDLLRDDSAPGNAMATLEWTFTTACPPRAVATWPGEGVAGRPITLDASNSSGNVTSYRWTVVDLVRGPLGELRGRTVPFTFPSEGQYSVTLSVTDRNGLEDETTFVLTVRAPPAPAEFPWILVAAILLASAAPVSTEYGRFALFKLLLVPLYARRRRNELLEHQTRGMIMGYILVHPGDTYTDIKRNLQLTNGTLSYHLAVMEREGLIRSQTRGAHKLFFSRGARTLEDGGGLHEVQVRMLGAIRELPGLAVRDLAGALGISSQHALYHLRALAAEGYVRLERRGVRLRCYPEAPGGGSGPPSTGES